MSEITGRTAQPDNLPPSMFMVHQLSGFVKHDAWIALHVLKQGEDTVDQYITQFETLRKQSEYNDEHILTYMFRMGLNKSIRRAIFCQKEELPTTLEGYMSDSRRHDRNQRERAKNDSEQRTSGRWSLTNTPINPPQDPHITHFYQEEVKNRDEYVRRGLCFDCDKQGHIARHCPERRNRATPTQGRASNQPLKGITTAKAAFAYTRTVLVEMDEKNRDIFFKLVDEEGFFQGLKPKQH